MSSRSLPPRPSLTQIKLQARELRRDLAQGSRAAAARIAGHHPRFRGVAPDTVLERGLSVADAQLVIAREYGFESWPTLKQHVEITRPLAKFAPHPRFDAALEALDAGDTARLQSLLRERPELVRARTNLEPPYHYFTGATLLHHTAGNPDRVPLPGNIADIARVLLESGAEVDATTLGPNGGTTMALVLSSRNASEANVSGPLMDVLLQHGAHLDVKAPGALDFSLTNHAVRAAEKLIELGACPDMVNAAALGRMDSLRAAFGPQGRLREIPQRPGRRLSEADAIGLAALFAYVRGQREAFDFLLEHDGNWNMIGVNNGTILHRAAWDADLATVKRMVALGADIANRENPFVATPLSWADHNRQTAIVAWFRENCRIDLHDAASFGFPEQVRARLDEDPRAVDARLDQWWIPESTALHCAATAGQTEIAGLLLDRGADPNALAGNGLTPLDIAELARAQGIVERIRASGGRRSAEL